MQEHTRPEEAATPPRDPYDAPPTPGPGEEPVPEPGEGDALEEWADYFGGPAEEEEDLSAEVHPLVTGPREPLLGTVKVVLEDGSCLVAISPEESGVASGEVLVRNEVFPTLRQGDPVIVYPPGGSSPAEEDASPPDRPESSEGAPSSSEQVAAKPAEDLPVSLALGRAGWSLFDPGWYIPPGRLTLEFLRATLGLKTDRFLSLVREILGELPSVAEVPSSIASDPTGQNATDLVLERSLPFEQHARLYEGLRHLLLSGTVGIAVQGPGPAGKENTTNTDTGSSSARSEPSDTADSGPDSEEGLCLWDGLAPGARGGGVRGEASSGMQAETWTRKLRAAFFPTYGDTVSFTITGVDTEDGDLLHGTIHDSIPGLLRRDALTLPQSLPFYPFDAPGAVRRLKAQIVAPSSWPVRVGKRHSTLQLSALDPVTRASWPLEQPGLFLLALHALSKKTEYLPAVVLDVKERMKIDLYGVILDVVPEQTTWDRSSPADLYQEGQTVPIHVSVDLERFTVITSLRSVEGPEWAEVVARFPPGTLVRGARYFMRTREGLLFHLPSHPSGEAKRQDEGQTPAEEVTSSEGSQPGERTAEVWSQKELRLHGLVPYGELTEGNEPTFVDPDDLTNPVDLEVLGHDAEQRRLLLSWRRARPSIWEQLTFRRHDLIPVEVVWNLGEEHWVRWAAGHLARIQGSNLTPNQVLWVQVEEMDRERQHLVLAPGPSPTGWVITDVTADFLYLRSREGVTVRVVRTPALEQTLEIVDREPHRSVTDHGPRSTVHDPRGYRGQTLPAVLHRVDFKLQGPRVIFRPRSDMSQAIQALDTGTPRPVTVERFFRRGFLGKMDGLEVFLPFNQVANYKVDDFSVFLGQTFDCRVLEVDEEGGRIVVSRRVVLQEEDEREASRRRRELLNELEVGQIRRGVVRNLVDYGAFVDLGGVSGLLHLREISWSRVSDPSEIVALDQELDVFILSVDRVRGHVGLSLKQLTPDPWTHVPERYTVGSCHTGEVVNLVNYGAFIDLEPGVSGLLHLNEMSWKRISHPSEVVRLGQRIHCRILSIDPTRKHIALSLKQTTEDPWNLVVRTAYQPGYVCTGRVTNLTNFGIFVELEPGLEGLLHISELPDHQIDTYREQYTQGARVEVCVVRVEPEERKIGLSVRQLEELPTPGPWGAEREHWREPTADASEENAPPFWPAPSLSEHLGPHVAEGPRPLYQLALEVHLDSRHLLALFLWAGVDLKNQLIPVGAGALRRLEARLRGAEGIPEVGEEGEAVEPSEAPQGPETEAQDSSSPAAPGEPPPGFDPTHLLRCDPSGPPVDEGNAEPDPSAGSES
jgi:ribosomal protein S1